MGSFNGELTRVSGYLANPIPSPMRAPHQAGRAKIWGGPQYFRQQAKKQSRS